MGFGQTVSAGDLFARRPWYFLLTIAFSTSFFKALEKRDGYSSATIMIAVNHHFNFKRIVGLSPRYETNVE